MPTPDRLPQIDLRRVRQHESSQQRGWEELGYIVVPDVDRLPSGTRLERRGTPDGGVEFSCPAPAGGSGTWAWQSKYLFRLDAEAFKQMTHSVNDALDATPRLSRYAFVLPTDRTYVKPGGRGKGGMQRWDEAVAAWTASAALRGMTVEFAYIGQSDVLTALSLDRHAGAVRYFFDERLFTDEFFQAQVAREIVNLGGRYDPMVHVELDVAEHIDAVCRSPRWAERTAELVRGAAARENGLRRVAADRHVTRDPVLAAAADNAADAAGRARKAFEEVRDRLATPDRAVLNRLAVVAQDCTVTAAAAEDALFDAAFRSPRPPAEDGPGLDRPQRARPRADPDEPRRDALQRAASEVSAARRAAEAAARALTGPHADAAVSGALLIEGPAGCGKSHLVADAAAVRAAVGLPTLLVLGQHLHAGPIWPQIAAAADVNMSGDDLRGALETAARVRGAGRALLVVDAVNEGPGRALWRDRFNGFLADAVRHPWLAVVVTVRDTFAPVVLPETMPVGRPVRLVHPGLAGHEEEALVRYCDHYGLRLPDLPPLVPELLNPLFLRSLCRSVQARGLTSVPREATSAAWVFDGLLSAVNAAVCDPARLDADPADGLVRRAADALARAMLDADAETLRLSEAKRICLDVHPDRRHSKSLLEALVAEGVLLRETGLAGGGAAPADDAVRFTYQRLGDHLRADAVLEAAADDAALRDVVLALAGGAGAWARAGLIEALVLLAPERRGRELADVVGVGPPDRNVRRRRDMTPEETARFFLTNVLSRGFFNTLPWRSIGSFSERTEALLGSYLQSGAVRPDAWLSLLIGLACVPDHPLNVRRLDAALRRRSLPERDEHWSDQVLSIWGDESDPVTRTIDWAWSTATAPADDVAELAATLLAWLCSSPDRRLRDTATKALVRLLDGRTAVAARLVRGFADVDDPYVVERVLAAACGHVLRHRHAAVPADDIALLGEAAHDAVFGGGPVPTTSHALIRHYARTVVETADSILRRQDRTLDRDVTAVVPPYPSDWPLKAPPLRDLARRYGRPGEKYLASATAVGFDFRHYMIERGLAGRFALPGQSRRLASRRAAARRATDQALAALMDAVPAERRSEVSELLAVAARPALQDVDSAVPAWAARKALHDTLPDDVRDALERLEQAARRASSTDPSRPDPSLLGRWIATRILDLGWTPERFADRDRMLSRGRSAGWSQTERYGKKYCWIAYHELVGRLGDHCTVHDGWRDSDHEQYATPFQVGGVADIDPSVVLRGDEPPEDTAASRLRVLRLRDERRDAWWLTSYDRTVSADLDGPGWLRDLSDVPPPDGLVRATDPSGAEWVVVESHTTWDGAGKARDDKRQLWVHTQANIVRVDDVDAFRAWATEKNWTGMWMPTPSEHPTGLLGGYPNDEPWRSQLADIDGERRRFGETGPADLPGWQRVSREDAPDVPLALATADYQNVASRDHSATDLPRAVLPSPVLLRVLGATWSGADCAAAKDLRLGPVETEYSWTADGRIVAFASAGRTFGSSRLLAVRADALARGLAKDGLAIWTWLLGEKIYWIGGDPQPQRTDVYAAVDLTGGRPSVWGATVERVDWTGAEPPKVLLRQRPGAGPGQPGASAGSVRPSAPTGVSGAREQPRS